MEHVSLTELLGKKVKVILSGSELLLVYELDKYARKILNKGLTLEDTVIAKEVIAGEHFSYVYNNSLINLNYTVKQNEVLADYKDTERKYFRGTVEGVVLKKQTDDEWVYTYGTDKDANNILNGYNRSAGYVSLYAYMLVSAFKKKKKPPKLLLENGTYEQVEQEYVDILILKNLGNKLLKDKVDVIFSKQVFIQPEWEAYVMYQRQRGYMLNRTPNELKYKYMKANFAVGDVVLFYTRAKATATRSISKLIACYPAVIKDITKNKFKLAYYPMIKTLKTQEMCLKQVEKENEGNFCYKIADYSTFPECTKVLEYMDTGIDIYTYIEEFFILKLQKGTDVSKQYITNSKGKVVALDLDTVNAVYAIFEDRKVEYNKAKFLDTYFKKKEIPVYDRVKNE